MVFETVKLVLKIALWLYICWIFVSGLDKGECSEEEIERAKSMVPKSLESYVER